MQKQMTPDTTGPAPDTARGTNQSGLRAHNERLVLTLIRQTGPLSKAEIARMTGLSAQTVSVIMRGLEAEGLLAKCAPLRGKVGQPQVPMKLAAGGAYFLGLKVGRRSLDLILIDFLGTVLGRVHQPHRYPEPDGAVRFALDGIDRLIGGLPPEARGRVAGLGIALPFQLWEWAGPLGVHQSEMDPWRSRDIRAEIAAHRDFPVYMQNDATAACGAELVFGTGDVPGDFLYFFVGFFIGGGVVLNHRLYAGPSGNAGALGSMPVPGPDGQTRQLVDVASLAVLEDAAVAAGLGAETIWASAERWPLPDAIVAPWIAAAARGMAHAIAAAASVIDFEVAVIDGWLPPDIRARLVDETRRCLSGHPAAGIVMPEIRPGSIGSDARALGAASLPLSERFLLDHTSLMLP